MGSIAPFGLARSATVVAALVVVSSRSPGAESVPAVTFEAGAARVDITPPAGLPMWGYGARKDMPCRGTRDPLSATAVVLRAGEARIAIVGLDLGRSPARESIRRIREEVARTARVEHVFLVGSHTHHGPCVEVEEAAPTADYVADLRSKIVAAIVQAAANLRPARIGAAWEDLPLNRNRHTRIEPKPVDRRLSVVRVDGLDGKPIAVLVNFAAHPTSLPATLLEWSPDYPGPLRARVEEELGGLCVFLQGACGDLSTDRGGLDVEAYGRKVGGEAARIAKEIVTGAPEAPSIEVRSEEMAFRSRVDLGNPVTYVKYCLAFFKDLVDSYVEEYRDGVRPSLSVALLNERIGIVAVSGEVFSAHAIRLRERARLEHLLFLGCANGYHQYFPTIEAAAEGGYGADPDVAPAEIGAGERLMDRALYHLHDLRKPLR